jgi:hypothetical protein
VAINDVVIDSYTGRVGTVISVDEVRYRCVVDMGSYKINGCQSWFKPTQREAEATP